MPKFDRRVLNAEAKKYCFITNTYEKVLRLTEILNYIQTIPILHDNLALKGGTAINLTIYDLPRLSVDIDLDFTTNVAREEMLEIRKTITETLLTYMDKSGYLLDPRSRQHHALDGFKFNYVNSSGLNDVIKIEINYMLRCHILEPVTVKNKELGLIKSIDIRTLNPYEIFGSKLVALMTRSIPRDLYDFYNLFKYDVFTNEELSMIRKCAIYYRAISNEDRNYEFEISNIKQISSRDIKRFLYPVIRSNERFVLDDAIEIVTNKFDKYFIPNENELLFLENFKNKKYTPELLFDDKTIVDTIINHPMAIWKTKQ